MTGLITQQQAEFLRLLAKTGFITNKHLLQIGFGSPHNSKHHLTKRLLDGGYIGRVMIANPFGIGRKVMYFLVTKGAKFISELDKIPLGEITYTKTKGGIRKAKDGGEVSLIRADFSHKESYISTFIAFEKYLENTRYYLSKYYHYYQTSETNNTTLSIGFKNFRPDGIWFFEDTDINKPKFAYIVEIHRHSERKHIIKQLRQQVEAIKQRSLQKRFGIDYPHFVLSIFTDENLTTMRGVIEELRLYPEWVYMEKFFMFAKLEDLTDDFYNGLAYFGGIKKPIPKNI